VSFVSASTVAFVSASTVPFVSASTVAFVSIPLHLLRSHIVVINTYRTNLAK
jgi:hypothetical protein